MALHGVGIYKWAGCQHAWDGAQWAYEFKGSSFHLFFLWAFHSQWWAWGKDAGKGKALPKTLAFYNQPCIIDVCMFGTYLFYIWHNFMRGERVCLLEEPNASSCCCRFRGIQEGGNANLAWVEHWSVRFSFEWKNPTRKPKQISKSKTETDRNSLITEIENSVRSVFGFLNPQLTSPLN